MGKSSDEVRRHLECKPVRARRQTVRYRCARFLRHRWAALAACAVTLVIAGSVAFDPFALCNRSEIYAWLAWITNTGGDSEGSLPLFRKGYDGYVACSGADCRGALDQIAYRGDALIRSWPSTPRASCCPSSRAGWHPPIAMSAWRTCPWSGAGFSRKRMASGSDWRYLATAVSQHVDAIDADVVGLALPAAVIDKLYDRNARRVFALIQ